MKYFLNACAGAFSEIPQPGVPHHSFEEITGRLVHIRFQETKKGETMRLYIVDETNFYIVSMFVKSRPAFVFFITARNIDLHEPVKLKIRRAIDPKDQKAKDYLTICQNGNSKSWYYNEENKHLLPQGQDERREFLRKYVEEEMVPGLDKLLNPFPSHPIYKPIGSGNGLRGGYFVDSNIRVKGHSVSDDEVSAAGYNSRAAYIKRNRHFPK